MPAGNQCELLTGAGFPCNPSRFRLALDCYGIGIRILDTLRTQNAGANLKKRLAKNTMFLCEGAIRVCQQLYQLTGDPNYLSQAFHFAEQNKAATLTHAIKTSQARLLAGIPDSLPKLETRLQTELNHRRNLLLAERQKPAAERSIDQDDWNRRINSLHRERQDLIRYYEENYPRYYAWKYDRSLLDLNEGLNIL